MVDSRFRIGACAILLLLAASVATGKEWRGIVPLKSTRAEVERVFGVPTGSNKWISYYKLRNEIVVVHFESEPCESQLGKFGYSWNVPLETVTRIAVIPRGTHRVEEYKSTSSSKSADNGTGIVYYTDASAGLMIETYKNLVTLVEYYHEATQENLRCPQVTKCCIDFFHRFDEYTNIPFGDEKARLDNFMFHLNSYFGRGALEILGPSPKDRHQRLKRAARAKRYLVRERGFEPERLLIIDAGYNERSLTRLADYAIGGIAARIILYPQKDPEPTPTSRSKTRP